MASPFDSAGANHEGSDYAPLTTDEFFTGLVTNRNPLRDAMVPYLQRKFYQAGRTDSLWDGINMEISAKLTLIRRPGSTVYNSQTFPPIGRFYDFRTRVDGLDQIRVMVDTAPAVFDGTGPAGKTMIWLKSPGAGKTSFQAVGNTLYMGNGVDQIKWTVPNRSWQPGASYAAGDSFLDANGNIQVAFGYASAIVNSSGLSARAHPIGHPSIFNLLDVGLAGGVSPFANGQLLTFQSLGKASQFNGLTLAATNTGGGTLQFAPDFLPTFFAGGADTGIVYGNGQDTGTTGVSGVTLPAFSPTQGAPTFDGTVIWINKGSAIQKWGTASPTIAPTVSQVPVQSPYPAWAASTYYSPNLVTYNAANPSVFALLSQAGITGSTEPTFNATLGGNTNDGTSKWSTINTVWAAANPYGLQTILVNSVGGTLYAFLNVVPGTSGATAPTWPATLGAQIQDGGATWQNIGPVAEWNSIGASTNISLAQAILDPGGYVQDIELAGVSGATIPTFNETLTGITTDAGATWVNAAAFAVAGSATSQVAYSFSSSVNFVESNLSPPTSFVFRADKTPLYQGPGSDDPQIDTINIYRTAIGGSTFFYAGSVPAPAAGSAGMWTFLDTTPDSGLDTELQGAIDQMNNPPPAGLTNLAYHMGRIWGNVGSVEYFCTGPDATVGNGNEAWSPSNDFPLPDTIARAVPWDLPNGVLIIFTAGDPYAIWGTGTAAPQIPFYDKPFNQGQGLLSYDALEAKAGWISMFTTDMRFLSFQPTAAYNAPSAESEDAGALIGDQFVKVTTGGINAKLYSPQNTYVTFHSAGTDDTGVIVADGSVGWFRISPIPEPETQSGPLGTLWSPRAAIVGGTSAVQSIETTPGIKTLLIGPAAAEAPLALLIDDIQIVDGVCTISHSNLFLPYNNTPIALTGLTTIAALNGASVNVTAATNGAFSFATSLPNQALTAETGTGTVGAGYQAAGPILKRGPTVNSDNGTPYPQAYATLGSMQLCQPSETAEVAEIIMDSMRVGDAPTVGVLLDEINPTTDKPFNMLETTANDPPLLPESKTLFSQAFTLMQNGEPTTCRHMQLKIQLVVQDEPDEILTTTVYGRRMAQRKAPAAA